jgi:uncharacterized protein (DUF983 family)
MHRTLAEAQLQCKCPRCREGDIFKYQLRENIFKFGTMNKTCAVCMASFEPEPGFYYGAMFVSYALSVGIFIAVGVPLYLLFDPSDTVYVIVIGIAALLFVPFSFRYSRVLFLYWFGGYRYRGDSAE